MSLTIRIPRKVAVTVAALALFTSGGVAVAAVTAAPSTATCTANPAVTIGATSESFSVTCSVPNPAPVTVTVTAPASTLTTTSTTGTASTTTTATASPTSTTTSPTRPPATGWPDASNTGVPTGTTLTTYPSTGAIHVPSGTYDARTFNGDLIIDSGQTVTITRSRINGRISSVQDSGHVTISDSRIDGGQQETFPAVGQDNISLTRVEVVGGQHSVQCWLNCSVTDSWLHGQYLPTSSAGHVNAFISNGGSGFTLTHNTLDCTVTSTSSGGGCTADASLFGDFSPIAHATFKSNLFVSHSTQAGFCTQAGYNPGKPYPTGTYVVYDGNTFQHGSNGKCGQWGAVTAWSAATGNQWINNVWDTGELVQP